MLNKLNEPELADIDKLNNRRILKISNICPTLIVTTLLNSTDFQVHFEGHCYPFKWPLLLDPNDWPTWCHLTDPRSTLSKISYF
jgi:hypothetical protein